MNYIVDGINVPELLAHLGQPSGYANHAARVIAALQKQNEALAQDNAALADELREYQQTPVKPSIQVPTHFKPRAAVYYKPPLSKGQVTQAIVSEVWLDIYGEGSGSHTKYSLEVAFGTTLKDVWGPPGVCYC